MRTFQLLRHIFLCVTLALTVPASAATPLSEKYTVEHPLLVVCDWDLPPYEYRNDDGQPSGYDVDVLKAILDWAELPYKFIMRDGYQAVKTMKEREADLIIAPRFPLFDDSTFVFSHNVVDYYKVCIASRNDVPVIKTEADFMKANGVVVRTNNRLTRHLLDSVQRQFYQTYSTRSALMALESKKFNYFIWGEEPLKWKINELGMKDAISINSYLVRDVELYFVSHDKELMEEVDDRFSRLLEAGEIQSLRDKWFHPERVHDNASPLAVYIALGISLFVALLLLTYRITRIRVKQAARSSMELNEMMTKALGMGNFYVLDYNVKTNRFTNRYSKLITDQGLSLEEFSELIYYKERESFITEMNKLASGATSRWEMVKRMRSEKDGDEAWRYIHGQAMTECDVTGTPLYVVLAVHDVTREITEQRKDSELTSRYRKIFEASLVCMSFYDKEGRLLDLNENMKELCNFDKLGSDYFRNTRLSDVEMFKGDFDPTSLDYLHVCQHMYYPEMEIDKYIEYRIRPVPDEQGEILFYSISARDVTDERTMYLEQKRNDEDLHKTSDIINKYEEELGYLLEKTDMFVWNLDLATNKVRFSRSLKHTLVEMTIDEYIACMYDNEHLPAKQVISDVSEMGKPFNVVRRFHKSPLTGPGWFAVSGLPLRDADGKVTGSYGVLRNVTGLMEAQERLKMETARAQDSGQQKSMFLANMTHEIRTPLNAIVGFSDLLQVVEEPADRLEFIHIIRNNCDMLLRLINDILEASTMDSGAQAITPENVDFSKVFEDICQSLAQRVDSPDVSFLTDNPYPSLPLCIDRGRIQQVITNFVTNAVKYTKKGHIKVGYRMQRNHRITDDVETDGLYIYCEDTGVGIPKEKQKAIFDRFVKLNDFVQGTGLGLSICKTIAERCGGRIGVMSRGEGTGSTFWLWIPCEK